MNGERVTATIGRANDPDYHKCRHCFTFNNVHNCQYHEPGNCPHLLCKNPECHLEHLYSFHPRLIGEINRLENQLKSITYHIVIAQMNHKLELFDGKYKAGFVYPIPGNETMCRWSPIIVTSSRELTTLRLDRILEQPSHIERKVYQVYDVLPWKEISTETLCEYGVELIKPKAEAVV